MDAALHARLCAVDGVVESDSAFSDRQAFWVNGTEVAHLGADGRLEVRLTRAVIREHSGELADEPAVTPRSRASDWVVLPTDDAELCVRLVELAAEAHRAPAGLIPAPPPAGVDLERRRRFH